MALRGGPLRSSYSASTVPGWRIEDFHRLLTHFFEEGVVQGVGSDLAVSEKAAGANMSVDVAAGLALIEVTTTLLNPDATLKTWLYNSATVNVAVPAADATNPRKDRIVAKFDMTTEPDATAANNVSIELIEGTPAGSPTAEATPSDAISLAIVDVAAGATSIANANITDERTYVTMDTGVLTDVARVADLASTATGKGASTIAVEDDAGNFTGTNVETVLAELNDAIPSTSTIQQTTLTAGETINGETLPVPVYQKAADGELYACDANDTDAMNFIGFAVSNSTDGQPIQFQGAGVVGGFTGLTVGAEYYVSDTVGTISATAGTQEIVVGRALSATQLLIQKQPLVAMGSISDLLTTSAAENDATVTIGFKPKRIVLNYYLQGNIGNGQGFVRVSGRAVFKGTTLIAGNSIGASTADESAFDNAAPSLLHNSPVPILSVGASSGANDSTKITLSINSVTATGFVIRRLTEVATGSPQNMRAKITYEAYE